VKGDWGADVIARIGGECLVVQCKDWGGPVGLSAVQEIAFARTHYQAQLAAVVARNGYTRAAKGAAKTTGVYLLGLDDLRVGTSVLDRSEEGARLREDERRRQAREAEFELERQAAVAWRYFDQAITRRRFMPLFKKLLVAMIIVSAIGLGSSLAAGSMALLGRHEAAIGASSAAGVLAVGVVLMLILLSYPPPAKPHVPKRSALRDCPSCQLRLRVEVGRSGWLTCPRCNYRGRAET
jgi:Restriction endonuclease